MGFDFVYTLIILLLMTIALVKSVFETEIVLLIALLLYVLGGIITVDEAFSGFSNHGMLTVAFLFIISASLQKTGVLSKIGNALLGTNKGSISVKLMRLLYPVSVVSAFFNNTPIVAMLIPTVRNWARKNDYAISKFLIPLSYAAILGGMCTLIGTSTNLVVHGLLLDSGFNGFSLFEFTRVGLPIAVVMILLVAISGHSLLPQRNDPMVRLGKNTREFVIEMKVESNYQHLGISIQNAGLRHLKGLFLFQIERDGNLILPVTPDERINESDRLFFTGLPETIVELQKTPGLSLLKQNDFDLKHYDSDIIKTFEVVVSPNSPLVGKNARQSNFRRKYNAVILAVHRSGERIQRKIGDVVIRPGDTLLILASKDFLDNWYHSNDFNLISESANLSSKPKWYGAFSLFVLVAMIVIMATGVLPILTTVSITAMIFIISKCISARDAWKSIDWPVLLVIAAALGISKALTNSGVALFIGHEFVGAVGSFGVIGLLAGIYFTTSLYTEIITNNAAAAIMFPIALSITSEAHVDPRPFFIAVALAASASFATPIGYQTNLMVYSPGGYKFTDFLKIGIPMNILVGVLTVGLLYFYYF